MHVGDRLADRLIGYGIRRVFGCPGGRSVNNATDVASAVDVAKKAGRSNVLVGVFRNGRTTFLPLKASGAG